MNLAISSDFYPAGTPEEIYFEQGTGQSAPPLSPVMSASGQIGDSINGDWQCSQPGPWIESPTLRYQVLIDQIALRLRAYRSLDNGATWIEVDAAHAPAVNNNSALPNNFTMFAASRDTAAAVRRVYCAYWDTDNTVTEITLDITFGSEAWGAKNKSTLAFLSANVSIGFSGFTSVFRPSDGAFIVAINNDNTAGGDRDGYAKFLTGSVTWDAAWTLIGQSNPAAAEDWYPIGAVLDPATNVVHFQFLKNVAAAAAEIQHQALHADGSLAAVGLVASIPNLQRTQSFLMRPIARTTGGTIELMFGWEQLDASGGNIIAQVARGVAADVPAWSIETMFAPGALPSHFFGFQLVDVGDGTVTGVGLPGVVAANTGWYQLQGPGVWIQTLFATTTTAAAPGFGAISLGKAAGSPIPPALNPPRMIAQALITPFPTKDPCCCPKLVGCVECAKDGNMYAISKTPLVKGSE